MGANNRPEETAEGEGQFFSDVCPKRSEAARKAANTRAYDDVPTRREMSLAQRLELGFEMLSDDDIKDDDE